MILPKIIPTFSPDCRPFSFRGVIYCSERNQDETSQHLAQLSFQLFTLFFLQLEWNFCGFLMASKAEEELREEKDLKKSSPSRGAV